jgi:Tfp pilus assembly protein PilX
LGAARKAERGATLVALLAVMTFMTLLALAAAPSILQQAQRERAGSNFSR